MIDDSSSDQQMRREDPSAMATLQQMLQQLWIHLLLLRQVARRRREPAEGRAEVPERAHRDEAERAGGEPGLTRPILRASLGAVRRLEREGGRRWGDTNSVAACA